MRIASLAAAAVLVLSGAVPSAAVTIGGPNDPDNACRQVLRRATPMLERLSVGQEVVLRSRSTNDMFPGYVTFYELTVARPDAATTVVQETSARQKPGQTAPPPGAAKFVVLRDGYEFELFSSTPHGARIGPSREGRAAQLFVALATHVFPCGAAVVATDGSTVRISSHFQIDDLPAEDAEITLTQQARTVDLTPYEPELARLTTGSPRTTTKAGATRTATTTKRRTTTRRR